jgi:hypothetical protein
VIKHYTFSKIPCIQHFELKKWPGVTKRGIYHPPTMTRSSTEAPNITSSFKALDTSINLLFYVYATLPCSNYLNPEGAACGPAPAPFLIALD